jgi:hypothetical protein
VVSFAQTHHSVAFARRAAEPRADVILALDPDAAVHDFALPGRVQRLAEAPPASGEYLALNDNSSVVSGRAGLRVVF